ncbi:MFS transporter [Sphingorhabdus lutea]|uniref:MFS transporter n=1 Tax=Sphingorhabdus lutea TaxID=1913578 RepID=A0A1L3JE93_9SPHN|nr:MFS transporter [Sphingorhabdus lutea]
MLGVACGASPIPFNVIGFTIDPLIAEFGWSRTQILLPITIFGILASLLAPIFGWMADKYGVRPVALWSLFAFGLSFAALSLTPTSNNISTLYIYYGFWVVIGLVGMGSTPISWSRAINLWFYKNRGFALGLLLLGTSLAAIIVPKLTVWIIAHHGWRAMFFGIALLPLLIALPTAYFLFREPRAEERPSAIMSQSGELTGVTLNIALRDYRFWLIWVSIALIASAFGGFFINLPSMMGDKGFTPQTASSVMGILGMGILSGRIITGLMLDRFWQGFVAFPLLCLPAISSYIFMGSNLDFTMVAFAGFLLGFAAGAEADLIAYLAGRYFGMAHYGKIYGMLYMPFGLFSAISPIIYASVRDNMGSYNPIYLPALCAFILGGFCLLLLGKYPDLDEIKSNEDRP